MLSKTKWQLGFDFVADFDFGVCVFKVDVHATNKDNNYSKLIDLICKLCYIICNITLHTALSFY